MRKERENIIAKYTYRILSERIAIILAHTTITPNQISFISVITSIIAGFFFGTNYLIPAFILLQLTIVLDHVDGNLARLTGQTNEYGVWIDQISNKLHKFFLLFGASIGVFIKTNNVIYLIIGTVAIFNWFFTGYLSETRKVRSVFKESNKSYFPGSLILYNLLGLCALFNHVEYALWFIAIVGFVWVKKLFNQNVM